MKKTVRISELVNLMELHPTHAEIAAFFHISIGTWKRLLENDPSVQEAYASGQGLGKIGLRRKQFALADHNASMAIHLGKQLLGQEEKSSLALTGADGGPIETYDYSKLTDAERTALRSSLQKAVKSSEGPS